MNVHPDHADSIRSEMINPVRANEELHASIVNTIDDLDCKPNLFCFGKGSLKERYIRQDACLSVCFLPEESYVYFTRAQRMYSLVFGMIVVVVGLGVAEVMTGKHTTAMTPS
eukprot:SAG31_NODE_19256_length_608_cov_0.811395_1_plen_111_part_10